MPRVNECSPIDFKSPFNSIDVKLLHELKAFSPIDV